MTNCDRHRWRSGFVVGVVAIAGVGPSVAHADPIDQKVLSYTASVAHPVCMALDKYPNLSGVAGVMRGLSKDSGFTADQVGQVVTLSVVTECPRHTVLLEQIVALYGPQSGVVA